MVQLLGRVGGKGEFIEQKHLPQRYFVEIAVYCLNQIRPAFSYNWITGLFSTITHYPATRIHSKREKREN